VLARDQRLNGDASLDRASRHCFNWDGRDDAGNPVPPGVYRLRLSLRDADRVAISGERLTIPEPVVGGSG
jgi:flagellar hook assembly protein FlgD